VEVHFAAVTSPILGLLGIDNTYMRLVLEAGLFAKFILLLLLTLSVISWGVALDKWSLFRRVEAQARSIPVGRRMRSVHDLSELMTPLRRASIAHPRHEGAAPLRPRRSGRGT
jgi:biopolymer transport protein ExbB/TolQ